MTLGWVNVYLCANVLIIAGTLMIAAVRAVSRRLRAPLSYRHLRHIAGLLAAGAVLAPLWTALSTERSLIPPIVRAWSAPSMSAVQSLPVGEFHLSTSMLMAGPSLSLDGLLQVLRWLFWIGLAVWLVWLVVDARRAARVLREAHVMRRVGRVWLLAASNTAVPFAFWTPWRSAIVVPIAFLGHTSDLRMAIRHEAQHHRQGDTLSVYLLQVLRGMFLCNPAAHLLARQLTQLQELACDEAVLRRSTVCASDYCQCLVRAVESALHGQGRSLLQTGMAGSHRSSLIARTHAALFRPQRYLKASITLAASAALLAILLSVSVAVGAVIRDQRISMRDANAMVEAAGKSTAFPLVMNAAVAEQLNLLLGTQDGRRFVQSARARMEQYRPTMTRDMATRSLPVALLAVPLIESGYRNLPAAKDQERGAGLWMFIARTATRYGLQVSPDGDERLNVALETDAAARFLGDLYTHFGDWQLALLAYNAGVTQVDAGIRATGTRNAWRLIERGYGNDPGYLARIMAAMIILGDPRSPSDL
ncbi:MAG TPA: M56 family metallopeptidase [Steroidobacteraceae bacterium]|nr:M56 family metallopeptidase [Steroidobacteraceae bacterium]